MKNKIFTKFIVWSFIVGLTLEATPVWALTKEETIYAQLNQDGTEKQVLYSEHLSDVGNTTVRDKSHLKDIVNVNGEESYREENGNIVWEANGKDIYYQGISEEKMPIGVQMRYYLDGQEKTIDEILGKSGKVKIVLQYENKLENHVIINGKVTKVYTPFVIAMTTILSNAHNHNIQITNGKVIDNGNSSIVVGLASPGLYDSLGMQELKSFDRMILSYDTDCFELSSIYSVATNKLIEESDLDVFQQVDRLYSSIQTLSDSSKTLVEGSEKLANGSASILQGTGELKEGIANARQGSQIIADSVKSSIQAMENDSSSALDEETLHTIVEMAKAGASLSDTQKKAIGEQAIRRIQLTDTYQDLETKYKQTSAMLSQVQGAYEQAMASGDTEQALLYKTQLESITQGITTYKTMMTLMEETARQTSIQTAEQVSVQVAAQVSSSVATSVAENAKETFTKQVVGSLTTLSDGLDSLRTGLEALDKGASTLYDGTQELNTGLKTLHEGMERFDAEGIQSISSFVNGDLRNVQLKLEAMAKLSADYQTVDDISDSAQGTSKIIMMIDAVKLEEEKKVNDDKIVEENKSLGQKIKGLFTK